MKPLETILAHLGAILGRLGAILGHFGVISGHLDSVKEVFADLRRSRSRGGEIGPRCAVVGLAILEPVWGPLVAILGLSCVILKIRECSQGEEEIGRGRDEQILQNVHGASARARFWMFQRRQFETFETILAHLEAIWGDLGAIFELF